MVRRYRPRSILELGSGWSTAVFAGALIQNGDAFRLESWEHDPNFLDETRRLVSSYVKFVPVHQSTTSAGVRVFDYEDDPMSPIDLLYVDGPPHTADCLITATPVRIEHWLSPGGHIVVDGRRFTVDYLREHLTRNYKIDTENDTTTFEVLP
jgi:predicted O-methyltransferase YrrM